MVQTAVFPQNQAKRFLDLKTFLCSPSICHQHPEDRQSPDTEGEGAGAEGGVNGLRRGGAEGGGAEEEGIEGGGAEGGGAEGGGAEGGGAEGGGAEGGAAE